jgi:hypothetical protein
LPRKGISLGTTQGMTLLKYPFNLGNPLNIIPHGFSYSSSQIVDFGNVVVSLGDYFCGKSKNGIAKRESKRQLTKETTRIKTITPKLNEVNAHGKHCYEYRRP